MLLARRSAVRFGAAVSMVALLAVAGPATGHAQGMYGGLRVGLASSNLAGKDAIEMDSRTAVAAGGFLTMHLVPMFALQPEAVLIRKGARATDADGGVTVTSSTDLTYLEIPMLLKVVPTPGARFRPTLFAGPAVGLLLSAKERLELPGFHDEKDVKDGMKSTDLGLVFGAGLEMSFRTASAVLDARYGLGLSTINDDPGNDLEMKNRSVAVSVGFIVPVR
jgi:hypothetical protein